MNNPASYLRKPPSWIRSAQLMIFLGLLIGTTSCRLPFQELGSSETTPVIPTNATPMIFVPTPDCGLPTLLIGSTTFQIQPLQIGTDGSLTLPSDLGIAYWVNEK